MLSDIKDEVLKIFHKSKVKYIEISPQKVDSKKYIIWMFSNRLAIMVIEHSTNPNLFQFWGIDINHYTSIPEFIPPPIRDNMQRSAFSQIPSLEHFLKVASKVSTIQNI